MNQAKPTDIDSFHDAFKDVVLGHIRNTLSADEWSRLRAFAADRSRFANRSDIPDLAATPEQLFDVAFSTDSISVQETLVPAFRAVEIGEIENEPVYYVVGRGVYLWGKSPSATPTLTFWLTHPAYPPGW